MRGRLVAVAIVIALFPWSLAAAQNDTSHVLHEARVITATLEALPEESILSITWNASAPVDLLIFTPEQLDSYRFNASWTAQNGTVAYQLDTATGILRQRIPAGQQLIVAIDNTDKPDGGAPGNSNVTFTWDVGLYTVFDGAGPVGLVKTATFQQRCWPIPGAEGVAIAPQAILFLALAVVAEFFAWRQDKKRWIDLGIMIGLGALVTTFISSKGVILPDTRLLTIPAAILSWYALRRYTTLPVAAAGIFAAAFWGPFLGADVLSAIVHHAEIRDASLTRGSIYVIGGAGWSDGLVVVPLIALAGFVWRAFFYKSGSRLRAPPAFTLERGLHVENARRDGDALVLVIGNPTASPVRSFDVQLRAGTRPSITKFDLSLEPGASREVRVHIPRTFASATHVECSIECGGWATKFNFPIAGAPAPPDDGALPGPS